MKKRHFNFLTKLKNSGYSVLLPAHYRIRDNFLCFFPIPSFMTTYHKLAILNCPMEFEIYSMPCKVEKITKSMYCTRRNEFLNYHNNNFGLTIFKVFFLPF